MLWLTTVVLCLICILSADVVAEPDCIPVLLGTPIYSECRKLLFGDGDFRSPGMFGIAAIDDKSHAFTIPRAEREYESDSEWAHRVPISKIWANCDYTHKPQTSSLVIG